MAAHVEALHLVPGQASDSAFRTSDELRLRPGERPVWLDLKLQAGHARRWRSRSAAHGLSVDVWLGLLLEYGLASQALRGTAGARIVEAVVDAARRETAGVRVPPTRELRAWIAQLSGDSQPGGDNLPSVVLAARVLVQVPHRDLEATIMAAADSGHEIEAVTLDQAAAAGGQTLEAWAYLAALRLGA